MNRKIYIPPGEGRGVYPHIEKPIEEQENDIWHDTMSEETKKVLEEMFGINFIAYLNKVKKYSHSHNAYYTHPNTKHDFENAWDSLSRYYPHFVNDDLIKFVDEYKNGGGLADLEKHLDKRIEEVIKE